MKVYQEWFLAQTHMLGRLSKENNEIYVYKYVEKETKLDSKTFPVFNSQIPEHINLLPGLRFAVSYSRELILFYNNKINRDYLIVTTLFQVPRYELPEHLRHFELDELHHLNYFKERITFAKENNIEVKPLLETNRKIGEELKPETCLPLLKSL